MAYTNPGHAFENYIKFTIRHATGIEAKILDSIPVSGGSINDCYTIKLSDERDYS